MISNKKWSGNSDFSHEIDSDSHMQSKLWCLCNISYPIVIFTLNKTNREKAIYELMALFVTVFYPFNAFIVVLVGLFTLELYNKICRTFVLFSY